MVTVNPYHAMIACPQTGKAVRTGIAFNDLREFDAAPLWRISSRCPHCGAQHVWSKGDAWLDATRSTGTG